MAFQGLTTAVQAQSALLQQLSQMLMAAAAGRCAPSAVAALVGLCARHKMAVSAVLISGAPFSLTGGQLPVMWQQTMHVVWNTVDETGLCISDGIVTRRAKSWWVAPAQVSDLQLHFHSPGQVLLAICTQPVQGELSFDSCVCSLAGLLQQYYEYKLSMLSASMMQQEEGLGDADSEDDQGGDEDMADLENEPPGAFMEARWVACKLAMRFVQATMLCAKIAYTTTDKLPHS